MFAQTRSATPSATDVVVKKRFLRCVWRELLSTQFIAAPRTSKLTAAKPSTIINA